MKQEEFAALVARLEEDARRDPGAYKLRVVGLALLGYAYLIGVLALLGAMLAASIASVAVLKGFAIKLILPIAAFAWLVLRSMWVRIEPPAGHALVRAGAPQLFALVDELRRKLRAPRFHRILITDDFNAAVVQVPRLGPLGWHRNYLLIGLQLMKTLTAGQLEAVLAHEFGHLAGGHGRLSNWIYRLRMSWARLEGALQASQHWGSFMLKPFVQRFIPYFNAYSFPLARANEFEADAVSARLATPGAAAQALTGVNVMGAWLSQRFWPGVHKLADQQPQPSFAPFADLSRSAGVQLSAEDANVWLAQSMERKTDAADTHPSLADRLQALGQAPQLAPPAQGQSADALLGSALAEITAEFDSRWRSSIAVSWKERFEHVQKARTRLAQLDLQAAQAPELTVDEALEHARLVGEFGAGAEAELAALRALHARAPQSAVVTYWLALRLLERGDATGVALMEQVIALDEAALGPAAAAVRDYYWRKGEQQQAQQWHARVAERMQLEQNARQERAHLRIGDKLEAHGLAPEQLATLLAQLRTVPGVRRAYLARKTVKHLPQQPCLVLGFCITPWWRVHNQKRAQAVQQQILGAVQFPHEAFVANVEGANYRFHRKLRRMRGARMV